MKVSIMQPNLFMWGGLLKAMTDSDIHIVLDNVKASKNSRYNRNLVEGRLKKDWLTVPYIGFSRNSEIRYLEVNTSEKTVSKIRDDFFRRYVGATHFQEACAVLERTFNGCEYGVESQLLVDIYASYVASLAKGPLRMPDVVMASELVSGMEEKQSPTGIHLVNLLLESVGATTYLAAENTCKYASAEDYTVPEVRIQEFRAREYSQGFDGVECMQNTFSPNLSTLDTIAFMGMDSLQEYLDDCNRWLDG